MKPVAYLHRTHSGIWFLSDVDDPRDISGAGSLMLRYGYEVSQPLAPFGRDVNDVLDWAARHGLDVEQREGAA